MVTNLGRVFRTGHGLQRDLDRGWCKRNDAGRWRSGCYRNWYRITLMVTATLMVGNLVPARRPTGNQDALKWSFMNYYINSNKIEMLIILKNPQASTLDLNYACFIILRWGEGSPDAAGWEMNCYSSQLLVWIGNFSILCSQSRKKGQHMRQLLSAVFSLKLWGKLKQLLFSLISFIVSKLAGIIGLYVVFLMMKILLLFWFYVLRFLSYFIF